MCTAITLKEKDFYFGRTLDLEINYNEACVITPKNYIFEFTNGETLTSHPALIGTATVADNYPLYYEAANQFGLCAAGLNFDKSAHFFTVVPDKTNLAPYEFIPYILCKCKNTNDVKRLLKDINITAKDFSESMPAAPLHWIISDTDNCITVESTKSGLSVYTNKTGVLTNEPPFWYHITNLNNYINLTANQPQNRFTSELPLTAFSKGMGAIGLPGDCSSVSRFIRATFTKFNSLDDNDTLSRFFHILASVEQTKGVTRLDNGKPYFTVYTSCINASKGIFYYTTYQNRTINAISLFKEKLDGQNLVSYPFIKEQQINFQN